MGRAAEGNGSSKHPQTASVKILSAKWMRWGAAALLALGAWSCARPRGFIPSFRREPVPTPETLTAPLRERAKSIETLQCRARVSVWQPFRPGRRHFLALMVVRPPDQLRLRAYREGMILVFDLLADGEGLRLRDAIDKRYYAAGYERLRRSGSPWASISPSLLFQALAIEQTVLGRVASARSAKVRRRWKTINLDLETADGRVRIAFDRAGQRIVTLAYKGTASERWTRVRYGEMIEVEGVRLPRWAEIEHGPTRTRLRFDVLQYKINRSFRPEVFRLKAPADQPWLPLETLR